MLVADKLREARGFIERGWCQGDFQIRESVCIYGALHLAINGDARDCEVTDLDRQARSLIKKAAGISSILRWNDVPERTQADVLAAFDKAIELAEVEQ